MALTKIDAYEVQYSSNKFPPRIFLKSGNNYIGQLTFQSNEAVLPADGIPGGNTLYYHLDDFANCIDILRNESPVYFLFVGTNGSSENGLKTGSELVGDGDKA